MRKLFGFAVAVALLVGMLASCAKLDENMQPVTAENGLRESLLGKWRIERVDNRLCRSGNCTSVQYIGTADDFLEFRADSAYLQRGNRQDANSVYRDRFKADFSQPNGFVLSNFGWSARFRVIHHNQNTLVLEGTYYGSDPSAVFTDTYFLNR